MFNFRANLNNGWGVLNKINTSCLWSYCIH